MVQEPATSHAPVHGGLALRTLRPGRRRHAEGVRGPHRGRHGVRLATKRAFGRAPHRTAERLTERHHPARRTTRPGWPEPDGNRALIRATAALWPDPDSTAVRG
ncbi:hypothetical protein SAMN02787144_102654 [Streptomyces atratus]|uniref:Uncharacterized protein n=1 Tax=Streptomyces atratus TaxID=1893 RepID=A0A1K2F1I3_STRAR|nr:hypothetical protein SAMN02787144_102654 [Streptomyces atratus]